MRFPAMIRSGQVLPRPLFWFPISMIYFNAGMRILLSDLSGKELYSDNVLWPIIRTLCRDTNYKLGKT